MDWLGSERGLDVLVKSVDISKPLSLLCFKNSKMNPHPNTRPLTPFPSVHETIRVRGSRTHLVISTTIPSNSPDDRLQGSSQKEKIKIAKSSPSTLRCPATKPSGEIQGDILLGLLSIGFLVIDFSQVIDVNRTRYLKRTV
jgi:hypothetical protein